MFRSIISVAVLVGLLASQWAVPHAHGHSAGKRAAEPHVHLGGHSHHHHDPAPQKPGDDHDATAVYVPAFVGMVLPAVQQVGSDFGVSVPVADLSTTSLSNHLSGGSIPWHPPDDGAQARPLFLTLRTLRI